MGLDIWLTIFIVVSFAFFLYNFISVVFRLEDEGLHKKRLKDITFDGSRIGQSDDTGKEFLTKVTEPVIRYIFPFLSKKDTDKIQEDLEFVGWDSIDADQFKALTFLSRIVAVLVFFLLFQIFVPAAIIVSLGLLAGPPFFLKIEKDNKTMDIIATFPEVIRLIQVYLAANQPLVIAVENAINDVDEIWQPYLEDFIHNAHTKSENEALVDMKNDIQVQQVKEFLSLVGLSLDQGANLFDAFDQHHEKVRRLKLDALMSKIHKRKNLALMVQYPVLLSIYVAIGIPAVEGLLGM